MKKIIIIMISLSIFKIFCLDKLDDLSFVDTEITQVIKTVSEAFGVTIVPDSSVQGVVTRYFKNTNLEQTLTLLLEPLGYVYEVKDGVYFVKKKPLFNVEYSEDNKLFNINSTNAPLPDIINQMSVKSKNTIVFDGSSGDLVNVNIFDKNLEEALKILTDSRDYELNKDKNTYYVKKKEEIFTADNKSGRVNFKGNENSIDMKIYNQSSNDVLLSLFKKFDKKLSLLSKKSVMIPYLSINNIKFEDLLKVIFEHTGQTFSYKDGVYYIYDSLKNQSTNTYWSGANYKLNNLSIKNFSIYIPAQIVPQTAYRLDPENNIVSITGSPDEVEYYMNFIKKTDEGLKDYEYRVIKLKNIDVKKLNNYLPEKYKKLEMSVIEDQNMFSVFIDNDNYGKLKSYLDKIDRSYNDKYTYKFKYLKPDDVLKSMLPKEINKDKVFLNNNDYSLIFEIAPEKKEELFSYLDSIDVPMPIIRYQLLIVEYIKRNSFKYNWGIGFKKGKISGINYEGGIFVNEGKTISANFDIPTVFGHYFSAFLELQLREEKAKIQMSTEIDGLSGEAVSLTNTQTLQYRDTITDVDKKVETPVYSSTTFGLNLEIKGRATTSNEIFLDVNAKISDQIPKQGDGAAPDTSEKSVKNSISTKSGKPIILGGLMSKKENSINNKIPGLGDIPIIGNLFKTHDNTYMDSEFVIYIIPFIQKPYEYLEKERREYIKKMYEYFVKG